jgi:hypothetical protein
MADTQARFYEAIRKVTSAQYVSMRAAGAAWDSLARAAGAEGGELSATAAEAENEQGEGLLILADRLSEAGGWADGAGTVARQIADQLMRAAQRSAQATERAVQLDEEYGEVDAQLRRDVDAIDGGMALTVKTQVAETKKELLIQQANAELDALGEEFALVIGGEPPRAPGGGAGATTAAGGYADVSASGTASRAATGGVDGGAVGGGGVAGGPAAGSAVGGPAAAQPSPAAVDPAPADYAAPNGSQIGAGTYPHASVLGPEQGDFAGWVQSPNTGFLVDPATGREFDPATSRWIDPVTGQPFGEVTEYATRLSGLADGPGALATRDAGTLTAGATVAGTAGLAALYGGIMPPSVGPTGPARGQVASQAMRNLNRNARVATRFAMQEAAQGGRPFVPPPGAAAQRGAGPYGRGTTRATVGAGRATTTPRGGGGTTAFASRGATAPGAAAARALMPPPGAAAAQGGSAARGGTRGASARGRAIGEPSSTWRARTQQAPARYPLTGARPGTAVPPPAPGAARGGHAPGEEERRAAPPTDLTEDPKVWATRRGATGGVVGE